MSDELTTPSTLLEGLEKWHEVAKQHGDDFKVKIQRRETINGLPETAVILTDVQVEHLGNVEVWLEPLAGGGPYYTILVWHNKFPEKMQGAIKDLKIGGPPKIVDPKIVRQPGWIGPKTVLYPAVKMPAADKEGGGGSAETGRAAVVPGTGSSAPASSTEMLLRDIAQRERALDEKRHASEVEALRREAEATARRAEEKLRDMEAKIAAMANAPRAAPTGPSLVEIISAVGGVLAPVIVKVMENGSQERTRIASMEAKRLELEAARIASEKDRPLIAPEILALLDKKEAGAAEQAKVFAAMSEAQNIQNRASQEAQGTLMRTTLQTVAMLMDTVRGAQDQGAPTDPLVDVVREAIKSVGALAEASKMRDSIPKLAPKPPQAPQRRAPAPPAPASGTPKPVEAHTPAAASNGAASPAMAGPPIPTLDDIESALRRKVSPKVVVDALLDSVEFIPATREEINAAGSIPDLLEKRMTPAWLEENLPYAQSLADELGSEARAERMVRLGFNVEEMAEGEEEEGTDA